MLKEKTASESTTASNGGATSLVAELFRAGLYKRTQGKIVRQATFAALVLSWAVAMWRWYEYLKIPLFDYVPDSPVLASAGIAASLFALGAWVSYRLVNFPRFADFLIAVEAEMNKVSWPSRPVLMRSSLVVIVCLLLLATVMFALDIFWVRVFQGTGVLRF